MSTQIQARPINRERPTAHEVLLAGIGAVSLIRKNAGSAWTEAAAIAGRVPLATSNLIDEIGVRSNMFRWEFQRLARELRNQASAVTTTVIADVEQRVQPVLRKLAETKVGLGIVVARPKGKRTTAKKAVRKVASKTVAKRGARKTRKAA